MWVWTILLLAVLPCDSLTWFNPLSQKKSLDVYKSSRNDRIDYIFKEITSDDLDTGKPLTEEVTNNVTSSSASDDIIVAILDQKLGGFGNETSNAIPMNPATEELWRTRVLEPIHNFLSTNKSWEKLTFEFLPLYDFQNSTRPSGFGVAVIVSVYHDRYAEFYIVKGYIPNPTKAAMPDRLVPYVYSTSSVLSGTGLESYEYGVEEDNPRYTRRVEKASKYVLRDHVLRGRNRTENEGIAKNRTTQPEIKDSDVPGQLISEKFDSGDSAYNIVPMEPRAVQEFKTRVEDPIIAYYNDTTKSFNLVRLDVHVVYEDRTSIRPVGFIAHIRKLEKDTDVLSVNNHFISN